MGIGTDLVSLGRIEALLDRHGDRFLARCFRQNELPFLESGHPPGTVSEAVALNWAAKEAFLKALGTDVRAIPYRDVEVVPAAAGPGRIILHGRARMAMERSGGRRLHLSTSQARGFTVAWVLVET